MKKIKTLKRKLNKLWSQRIHERDKICQWCFKKGERLHSHHWVSKGVCNQYGRYDVLNGVLLCFRCHIFRLKSEVDEYIAFRDSWLIERDLTYPKLRQMYRNPCKLLPEDYLYLIKKLEEKEQ